MKFDYTILTASGEEIPQKQRISKYVLASAVATVSLLTLWAFPWGAKHHVASEDILHFEQYLKPITLENASAVFNTVQGALRAKNAQIHPIGVGFIPVYIPEGTLVYHGNGHGRIPDGPEWIAMDHEFSYNFISDRANPRGNRTDMDGPHGPGGNRGGNRGGADGDNKDGATAYGPPGDGQGPPGDGNYGPPGDGNYGPPGDGNYGPPSDGQGPPNGGPGGGRGGHGGHGSFGASNEHVTLFTFQVVKPLNRMILFDGSSAAKTQTGEMDQQGILARVTGDRVEERDAARVICDWGKKFGLDGYIRIENGFEGVICDFNDKLAMVHNTSIEWRNDTLGLPLEFDGEKGDDYAEFNRQFRYMASYDWTKQGNIHDKREGRIQIDFRGMQTPLNKTWVSPDPYMRRILNISDEVKDEIINNLEAFLTKGADPSAGTDWQLMTTEIVDKFAPPLQMLNRTLTEFTEDEQSLLNTAKNITVFTGNFVRRFMDHHLANETDVQLQNAKLDAITEYVHFLQEPQSESDILIYSSLYAVVSSIVDVMFDSFLAGRTILQTYYMDEGSLKTHIGELKTVQQEITEVLKAIQWESTFYRCDRVCDWDEICYTPSWGPSPLGWGGTWGTHMENGHLRINNPLQCISYRTLMAERR